MENQSTLLLSMVSNGLSLVLSLALEVGPLGIALGPVRKHRPDAAGLLAGAAGLQLLCTLGWIPVTLLVRAGLSVDSYLKAQSVTSMVLALMRTTGGVLLLLGGLRLAVPVNRDPTRYE